MRLYMVGALLAIVVLVIGGGIVGNSILFYILTKQGDMIMATLKDLQDKIDTLTQVEADREARDVAQDVVTTAQITALQTTIDELRAIIEGGSLSPENQAIVDSAVVKVQATIDSLNAADPTAPIIP